MSDYLIVIEGEDDSFSAYSPDLPGCVAAGSSMDEVEQLMKEAIEFHLDSLRQHGESVPAPHSSARYVGVA